jgi:hypothetical protein
MSDFLVGRGLTGEQLEVLEAITSTEEVRALLASPDYFNVENFNKDERRRAIALDFHFYNYDFCKKTGLTHEATALFLKIMQITFSNDTNPPPSRTPTMENSFDAFVQLVLKHSVQNAPFQMLVFQREHVDQVQRTLGTNIYIALAIIHLTPLSSRLLSLSPHHLHTQILEYAMTSYFRQFRLFQYIFCSVPRVVIDQASAEAQ